MDITTQVEPVPNGGVAPTDEELKSRTRPLYASPLTDLPVNVDPTLDNPELVRRVLLEHDRGQFTRSAQLVEQFGRDARIVGIKNARVGGLLSCPLDMKAARKGKKYDRLAEEAKELWPQMFPEEVLSRVLASGLMMGIGLAEKVWNFDTIPWTPTLKYWHPGFLFWNPSTGSYWLITQGGLVEVPKNGGGRFLVYCPYGYERGFIGGLVRSVAIPWVIRGLTPRDWARYSEKHGLPILKATTPPETDDGARGRFVNSLRRLGRESVVECQDPGNDLPKYDLQLVEATANTWQGFEGLLKWAHEEIGVAFWGNNLTSQVTGGSFAATKTHSDNSKTVTVQDGNTLGRALQRDVLSDWAQFHPKGGDPRMAPLPSWQTTPAEDSTAKATRWSTTATAVKTLKEAGAPIDIRACCEEASIPLLSVDDPAADPAPPAPPKKPKRKKPVAP